MKEDSELGVSDDKESIYKLALSSPETLVQIPQGMKERKRSSKTSPWWSSFLRTQFVRVYKDVPWFMQTISV